MTSKKWKQHILPGFGFMVVCLVFGYLAMRPFIFNWGATPDEVRNSMPGDTGGYRWTRAISVNAAPQDIWPWLVQFGQGRGGWYSYDWLENLFGLDIHTASRVLPQFQNPRIGDEICLMRGFCSQVFIIEPGRNFGWHALGEDGRILWAFVLGLYPSEPGVTRLVVRESFDKAGMPMAALVLLEGPDLVMEQKALVTLKNLAEGRAASPLTTPLEIGSWLAVLITGGLAGLRVLSQPRWQLPLALGAASLLLLLAFTFLFPPLWLRVLLALGLAAAYWLVSRPRRVGIYRAAAPHQAQ